MIKYDGYDEAIIGPAYIWREHTQQKSWYMMLKESEKS